MRERTLLISSPRVATGEVATRGFISGIACGEFGIPCTERNPWLRFVRGSRETYHVKVA